MLPNVHVALCAYATYYIMERGRNASEMSFAATIMLASVVRNLIITSGKQAELKYQQEIVSYTKVSLSKTQQMYAYHLVPPISL